MLLPVLQGSLATTVLRSTQLHHLLARVFSASGRLPGGRILLQPIDPLRAGCAKAEMRV
jgi:hypothetical protein